MLAINEVANIGWFASDRNQPEGYVCVYVFIPNPDKEKYGGENFQALLQYAEIASIAATQTDAETMRKARQQLTMLLYEQNTSVRKGDFLFVIDDRFDYKSLSDFKSAKARTLFAEWQKRTAQHVRNVALLQQKRDEYAASNSSARNRMRNTILSLEQKVESEAGELYEMECEIRRLEQEVLYR